MSRYLTTLFILTCFWAKAQAQSASAFVVDTSRTSITTKLGIPFGTIAKLRAEICDGNSLRMKVYEDVYLLKIIDVNGKTLNAPIILTFKDETGTLANDDFSLYKLIYKKKANSLEPAQISKMKEKYVGKKLTLMAYEAGQFTGVPKDYFKYRPFREDVGFYFEHYMLVVSNLTR